MTFSYSSPFACLLLGCFRTKCNQSVSLPLSPTFPLVFLEHGGPTKTKESFQIIHFHWWIFYLCLLCKKRLCSGIEKWMLWALNKTTFVQLRMTWKCIAHWVLTCMEESSEPPSEQVWHWYQDIWTQVSVYCTRWQHWCRFIRIVCLLFVRSQVIFATQ